MCLEAEDGDILLLGLVQLTKLATELVLGNVCAVGVENVAVYKLPSELGFLFHIISHPVGFSVSFDPALTRPSDGVREEGCG